MRDPKRIEPMIITLRELWLKYPDWRLGQIIANAVREETGRTNCDPFFIEDFDMHKGLMKLKDM